MSERSKRQIPANFKEIIIEKSEFYCLFTSVASLGFAFWKRGFILSSGFRKPSILIFVPFAIVFFGVGFRTLQSTGNRIIINTDGILNQDYAKKPIPWEHISSLNMVQHYHPAPNCYLTINLNDSETYYRRTLFGKFKTKVVYFNVVEHKANHDLLLDQLREMHQHYAYGRR